MKNYLLIGRWEGSDLLTSVAGVYDSKQNLAKEAKSAGFETVYAVDSGLFCYLVDAYVDDRPGLVKWIMNDDGVKDPQGVADNIIECRMFHCIRLMDSYAVYYRRVLPLVARGLSDKSIELSYLNNFDFDRESLYEYGLFMAGD